MKGAGCELTDTGGGAEQFLRHGPNDSYLHLGCRWRSADFSYQTILTRHLYSPEDGQLRFDSYPTLIEALAACD